MHYREPFTIFPRRMKSGLIVYYYQTYDNEGRRTTARSTGKTSKTAARAYCEQLRKTGELIPTKRHTANLAAFSQNFWLYDKCQYVKSKLARGQSIGKSYCQHNRSVLLNYILPDFGQLPLPQITANKIEKWLLGLPNRGLSNETANKAFKCLKIILNEAQKQNLIHNNPCQNMPQLARNPKKKGDS